MGRQAVISLPLSFAIVLIAAIGLSGTVRDESGGQPVAIRHQQGTIADEGGPVNPEFSGTGHHAPVVAAAIVPVVPNLPAPVETHPVGPIAVVSAPPDPPAEAIRPIEVADPAEVGDSWRPRPSVSRFQAR